MLPIAGTTSSGEFAVATESQRTLKDLRIKRKGQPVYVLGHDDRFRGREATFEFFNIRLAVVRFSDNKTAGFDPTDLLLPCEIHEDGLAYFEIRNCETCNGLFPLSSSEFWSKQEPAECPDCSP